MNCVYDAFAQAVKYHGLPEYYDVWMKYVESKKMVYGNMMPYVFAGIVPWLYADLLMEFNIKNRQKLSMIIQWNYVTWQEVFEEADEKHKAIMNFMTEYKGENVDQITLQPAIYGLLNEQHAVFSETIPDWKGARIIMAIQIRKWDKEKFYAEAQKEIATPA